MTEYTIFPSIIPEADEPFVDDSYSKQELERMDWDELRGIASEVETDEINGKSDREDIEDFLEGHTRV